MPSTQAWWPDDFVKKSPITVAQNHILSHLLTQVFFSEKVGS
jgi:hypothetical protein